MRVSKKERLAGEGSDERTTKIRYSITGTAAHARIAKLLPTDWVDVTQILARDGASTKHDDPDDVIHFIWENAQRKSTKPYRDSLCCYSHLPNGTAILDSKWVLARLVSSSTAAGPRENGLLAVLESHCLQGRQGFIEFAHRHITKSPVQENIASLAVNLPDLVPGFSPRPMVRQPRATRRSTLWVIKDADANGAGGIWVVGSNNVESFAQSSSLHPSHRYVAQRYVWPMCLYQRRKCHVRVYALLTADGKAYVHQCAFLHVANEKMDRERLHDDDATMNIKTQSSSSPYPDTIHITNCCANSHDLAMFAGEICADLTSEHDTTLPTGAHVVGLGAFGPAIYAAMTELARQTAPFVGGGAANGGFEYLGLDFILSHTETEDGASPRAWLLEVNAPPSQDTATGLPHAEDLHDAVLRDLIDVWVRPQVVGSAPVLGGWRCVYHGMVDHPAMVAPTTSAAAAAFSIAASSSLPKSLRYAPSQAALLNKMKWSVYERQLSRLEQQRTEHASADRMAHWARSQFSFFSNAATRYIIFMENAGGAQVPQQVVSALSDGLCHRHRAVVGQAAKTRARQALSIILGAPEDQYKIQLGANATSLIATLSQAYSRAGWLSAGDEIILSSENHVANIDPWTEAARASGASIVWWHSATTSPNSSIEVLDSLLSPRTRIVALPHASNLIGRVLDIQKVVQQARLVAGDNVHVVVDGVATVPHLYANVAASQVDYYIISCHKLFGPHLGAIAGRKSLMKSLKDHADDGPGSFMCGTISYEACAGLSGLGTYYRDLASFWDGKLHELGVDCIHLAYHAVNTAEQPLRERLVSGLRRSANVRVMNGTFDTDRSTDYVPVVSFVHATISHQEIVDACLSNDIVVRHGTFLSSVHLRRQLQVTDSVVRLSLAHYNTVSECESVIKVLESIPGW